MSGRRDVGPEHDQAWLRWARCPLIAKHKLLLRREECGLREANCVSRSDMRLRVRSPGARGVTGRHPHLLATPRRIPAID